MSEKKEPLREPGPYWRMAEEAGVDMSLLEHSLSLTPEERIRENCRALALIEALQEAMEKKRGGV